MEALLKGVLVNVNNIILYMYLSSLIPSLSYSWLLWYNALTTAETVTDVWLQTCMASVTDSGSANICIESLVKFIHVYLFILHIMSVNHMFERIYSHDNIQICVTCTYMYCTFKHMTCTFETHDLLIWYTCSECTWKLYQ